MKKNILRYDTLDSTNEEARRLCLKGALHGTVIVAREQNVGRGRHGRHWASPAGGLWMTLLLRPDAEMLDSAPLLSIAAGVAAAETLEVIFAEIGIDPSIIGLGWPNDLLIYGEKKIGGILCESYSAGGETPFFVVGIGININNKNINVNSQNVNINNKNNKIDESQKKHCRITN